MYKYNEVTNLYEKTEVKDLKVLDRVKINLTDEYFSVVVDDPKLNEANIWTVKLA